MAVANTGTTEVAQEPTATERVADEVRQTAHFSHQARPVTSMARDAGEEAVHAAKRFMTRVRHNLGTLEGLKGNTSHYVKRQPFKAVGLSAGVGLMLGVLVGWIGGGVGRRRSCG